MGSSVVFVVGAAIVVGFSTYFTRVQILVDGLSEEGSPFSDGMTPRGAAALARHSHQGQRVFLL